MKIDWDNYFMSMAYLVAMKSKDKSSHIGAIIVGPENEIISTGYNGLPRGVNDDMEERDLRPAKYAWYEHAERNSIFNAARNGVHTKGTCMYTQGTPCVDCARAIIQAGITDVIVDYRWDEQPRATTENRAAWKEHAILSRQMFQEAGVNIRTYSGPLITELSGLMSEKEVDLHVCWYH